MPTKRVSRPARTASTKPAAKVQVQSDATTGNPARSKWDPRNIRKEHIMMAAPLLAVGQQLFKGPIESAKEGANKIMQNRVDDAVNGLDDKLSGRHRRHHRRHSDSGSDSSATGSKTSRPRKTGNRKQPAISQFKIESAKVVNIQLNLNVYPAALAGFAVQLAFSSSSQPSRPPVYIPHDKIYVADPKLFTYITFKMLMEYEYLSQQEVPSNTYEPPFELALAPDTLAYLEDPNQPGDFLDVNGAKRLYGIDLPYNPLSRFQLVVLPGQPGPQSMSYQGELARGYFQQHQDHIIRATRERQRRDPDFKIADLPPVADPRQKTLAQYFQDWDNCIQRSVLENRWIPNYTPFQPPSHTVYSQAQPSVQENRRRSSSASRSSRPDRHHRRRSSSSSESSKSEASEKKKEGHSYMPMMLPLMGAFGGGKAAPPASAPEQGPVSAQAPVTRKPLPAGHEVHERYPAQARHGSSRKEPSYRSRREPSYGIRREPSYVIGRRPSYEYGRELSPGYGSRRDAGPRSRPSGGRTRVRGRRGLF